MWSLGRSISYFCREMLRRHGFKWQNINRKGKTTDNHSIQVCLSEPVSSPINGWVEVIGVPTVNDRINCEEVSYSNFCCLMDWTRVVDCFDANNSQKGEVKTKFPFLRWSNSNIQMVMRLSTPTHTICL